MVSFAKPNAVARLEKELLDEGFEREEPTEVALSTTKRSKFKRGELVISVVCYLAEWNLEVGLGSDSEYPFDVGLFEAALAGKPVSLEPMPVDRQCAFILSQLTELSRLASSDEARSVVSILDSLRKTRAMLMFPEWGNPNAWASGDD